MSTDVASRTWIVDVIRHTFESTVDAYSWGFGEENARLVVGAIALAILVLITAMTAFCAFREVGAIGMKLVKLVLTLAVALFLGSLVVPTYEFVFPSVDERREAVEAAQRASEMASEWVVKRWLRKLV